MPADHAALQKFLARLLTRSTLSREEQDAILSLHCRAAQVQPRVDIVSPGQTVDYACLIAKGLAARFDQMRNGQRQITAFHIPGDMCDLHSVVAPTAAWGIAALTATTVAYIPHGSLRELANDYPAIALAFWRDSTADASVLAKWVGNLGRQDARARLAHVICELGMRIEQAGLGTRTSFALNATQEQLADALGLTAVHVNRTLQRLRAEGYVATRGQTIEILDWQRLVDVAEFDPAYLLLGKSIHPHRIPSVAAPAPPIDRPHVGPGYA
jgi:CRP-like cAMP-binding protein